MELREEREGNLEGDLEEKTERIQELDEALGNFSNQICTLEDRKEYLESENKQMKSENDKLSENMTYYRTNCNKLSK
jgi:chromosome segregation ATPase